MSPRSRFRRDEFTRLHEQGLTTLQATMVVNGDKLQVTVALAVDLDDPEDVRHVLREGAEPLAEAVLATLAKRAR